MSEWISVKEKFPPHKQDVLIYTGKKEIVIGFYTEDPPPVDPWASEDSIWVNDMVNTTIATCTHWRLLPQIPKE